MAQIRNVMLEAERLSNGPRHHLFGYHDLTICNAKGNKYLAIEADVINRPPLPGEEFGVGYLVDGEFIRLGTTVAMNYPQGARQQWVADTDMFTVNNRVGNAWGTDLYDAQDGKLLERYDFTTHILTRDGRYALGLDYARLHRLADCGYIGIADKRIKDSKPGDVGITITDMQTKHTRLLVSVRQAALYGNVTGVSEKSHQFLSNPRISPSGKRVAFLHRYFLPDGGLMTRVMTIGLDGSELRCLAQGFLSHYDWKDDTHLYIYGRTGSNIDFLREKALSDVPMLSPLLKKVKNSIRSLIGRGKSLGGGVSFIMLEDKKHSTPTPFAQNTIVGNGHPMTNPLMRSWCVCDTFPDDKDYRTLYLYNFDKDLRVNVGNFDCATEKPDITQCAQFLDGLDAAVLENITVSNFSFVRSGLECDLHPRWSRNGKWAVFDSIHEGTRQIYRVNVGSILEEDGI